MWCVVLLGCSRNPQAHVKRGQELLRSGSYDQARTTFSAAVRADRLHGPAYLGLGRASLGLGDLQSAAGAFRRAVELVPPGSSEWRDASIGLADVCLRTERDEKKLEEVESIGLLLCKQDPSSFDGRRLLGNLDLKRAEARWRSNDKARAQFFLNNAELAYGAANRARPGQAEVLSGLARSLALQGKAKEAENVFRQLITLEPRNPVWYAEAYRLLLAADKPAEADALLVMASDALPEAVEFPIMRAAQSLLSDPSHVAATLDRLAKLGTKLPAATVAAADFWVRAGKLERAKPIYVTCASTDGQPRQVCRARTLALLQFEDRHSEAWELAKQIRTEYRDDVDARLVEATTRVEARDLVTALNELQSILASDPQNFNAHYQLARVHMLSGEAEQARQRLTEALALNPEFLEAKLKLAQIKIIREEYRGAVQMATEIIEKHPDSWEARHIFDYADKRVKNPTTHGLWGPPTENVRRLALAKLVMVGDPSDTPSQASADRLSQPPASSNPSIAFDAIYLRKTLVDGAIRGYRLLAAKQYDRFDYLLPVPGVWPAAATK